FRARPPGGGSGWRGAEGGAPGRPVAARHAVPAVDGEAMLVSPEPQDGLRYVGAQLSRRVLIAVVERGVVLVVGEQHDTTVGQERSDDDAEPLEQPIFQRKRRLDPGELPEEGNL